MTRSRLRSVHPHQGDLEGSDNVRQLILKCILQRKRPISWHHTQRTNYMTPHTTDQFHDMTQPIFSPAALLIDSDNHHNHLLSPPTQTPIISILCIQQELLFQHITLGNWFDCRHVVRLCPNLFGSFWRASSSTAEVAGIDHCQTLN